MHFRVIWNVLLMVIEDWLSQKCLCFPIGKLIPLPTDDFHSCPFFRIFYVFGISMKCTEWLFVITSLAATVISNCRIDDHNSACRGTSSRSFKTATIIHFLVFILAFSRLVRSGCTWSFYNINDHYDELQSYANYRIVSFGTLGRPWEYIK